MAEVNIYRGITNFKTTEIRLSIRIIDITITIKSYFNGCNLPDDKQNLPRQPKVQLKSNTTVKPLISATPNPNT